MAYINFEQGKTFFYDGYNRKILLADLITSKVNRSRVHSHQFKTLESFEYPLFEGVQKSIKKFGSGAQAVANATIFFRILDKLLRKPKIYNVLYVGEWSALCEVLEEFLPKFNDKNFLYVLNNSRPIQNFQHAKFIFTEGEKYFLPENKFSAVIFSEINLPPAEIILSAKNFGHVYFLSDTRNISDEIKNRAEIFEFENNFAIFELQTAPELKNIFFSDTELGRVAQKKFLIEKTIQQVPAIIEKINSFEIGDIDKFIAELTFAEKNLAEIFPYLNSDTIKLNLNMLKEFFIDFRLREGSDLQKISAEKIIEQYKILIEDMKEDFL